MALVLANRVQESATPNTTVSFTLTGAVLGFQTFSVIGNGNVTYYSATDTSGNWEVGIGTYSTTGPTLTRNTVYASSNSGSPVTFPGSVNVFVTYPSGKSVNLDDNGNVSALGTVSSGTWQGSTVGVAYGGTGVTTSSGANSVMLRDANQNVAINRLNQANTSTTATGGTTVLTAASSYSNTLVGTGNQTFTLPDATTLTTGVAFLFNNMATGTITIQDYASATIGTITAGGAGAVFLINNSTVGGTWDVHGYLPEGVTWGTNALNLGTTVISNGTWQGGTIQPAYGGTGLTTFVGANNALYSTGATTLTAGTLPVAAGGTGLASYTANQVLYTSSSTAIGQSSNLTFDGTNFTVQGITVGRGAGAVSNNTAVGASALAANTTGAGNTAVGQLALNLETTGVRNAAFGTRALSKSVNGRDNTAVGYVALSENTTGVSNTAVGEAALANQTTGNYNTAVGMSALVSSATADYNTALGYQSAYFNSTGANNTAVGSWSLFSNTTASYNVAVGTEAGYSNTTGSDNTFVGAYASYSNTTGYSNASFGNSALYLNQTGISNTAVGASALYKTTGNNNTGVGYEAAYFNTTGVNNTAVGFLALQGNTTGNYNVAVGDNTLVSNTAGAGNVAIGRQALYANTSNYQTAAGYQAMYRMQGVNNAAVGYQAMYGGSAVPGNNSGTYNVAFGSQALYALTSGGYNVAIGNSALVANSSGANNTAVGGGGTLYLNTTGSNNVAIGFETVLSNSTGGNNTALGAQALRSNTTASNNTAVGYQAGYTNTTGIHLTAVGYQALYSSSTARYNTAVGYQAGYNITTAEDNVAIGSLALFSQTSGFYNTAVGRQALYSNTTAWSNTGIGYATLFANTTGTGNTAVGAVGGGASTLLGNTTGNYNTGIGAGALGFNNTASYNTAVGYQAGHYGTGSNFQYNTFVGYRAGYSANPTASSYGNVCIGASTGQNITTGYANTIIGAIGETGGDPAGSNLTTGIGNNFIGTMAGNAVTTGSQNTILGSYTGNQGGLDIRTASNYIVLSDGDGNPRAYWNGANPTFPGTATFTNTISGSINGSAAQLGGYGSSTYVGKFGNTYYQADTWIQCNGIGGLYWPATNAAELNANTTSTYGAIAVLGSRNGWRGIHFQGGGNTPHLMFDGSANGGIYYETGGRWASYYNYSNDCWGVGTTTTSATYNLYAGKGLYSGGRVDSPIFYDSNDTSYYADFTSSTTSIKAAGALYQGSLLSRPYVQWGEAGTVTGAIVIKLPGNTGNYGMVHIVIDIYEYSGNNVTTVVIGGHNWSGAWYNYGANVIGYTNKPIRLCVVGGQFAVVIGNDSSSWSYGQVFLRKIQNGSYYAGVMDLGGSYSIYRTTSVGASWDSGDINSFRSTTITGTSSVRAPIFYDSDNTGYYLDPTSTTSLRTVGDWRSDDTSWTGEFAGKIQYHSSNWYFQYNSYAIFRNSGGTNVVTIDSSGNLVANGNVTAYSDEDLKFNWRDLPDNFIELLAAVRSGVYDRIDVEGLTQVGVSAQSLLSALPNAVTKNADGVLGVAYGNAALVSAVKLAEKVLLLEQRIKQLEGIT